MPYNTGTSLADLIYQRGQQQAAFLLDRGQRQANAWQQAGNAVSGAVDSWRQSVERNRQLELEQAREADRAELAGMQRRSTKLTLDAQERQAKGAQTVRDVLPLAQRQDGVVGYDRTVIQRELEAAGQADLVPQVFAQLDKQDAAHMEAQQMRMDAVAGDAYRLMQGGADEKAFKSAIAYWEANDSAPKPFLDAMREASTTPEGRKRALYAAVASSPRFAEMVRKAQEPDLLNVPEGTSVIDKRNPQAGPLFTAPKAEKLPTSIEDAILAQMPDATPEQLIAVKERMARAGRPVTPTPAEPLVAITGPDGKPVLVPRSQAVGKSPANTREQGRQVTSGDAGDIAEFNTALDDLSTLRGELEGNGATGTAAQMGAALWTPITNLTGWGLDAKAKQAQIDRVKQVIGKALEGGVLRKEDEQKYEKILPTIKDDPALVRTKLNGLVAAIQKRQQRKLDALDSAGYDVSRFAAPGATSAAGGKVTMRAPNGQTKQVDASEVEHYKALGAVVVK